MSCDTSESPRWLCSSRPAKNHTGSSESVCQSLCVAATGGGEALGVEVCDTVRRFVPQLGHGEVHEALRCCRGRGPFLGNPPQS